MAEENQEPEEDEKGITDAGEGQRNCTVCGRIVDEDATHCDDDEIPN